MRIKKLKNAPDWLTKATVDREDVTLLNDMVIWHDGEWYRGEWHGGEWHGGVWHGGVWHGGEWRGGVWHGGYWNGGAWRGGAWGGGGWYRGEWYDGVWRGGEWYGGEWRGGEWYGGMWHGGEWRDGVWHGGEWRGGEWKGKEDRVRYMCALAGIIFDEEGFAIAYRTTLSDGRGRAIREFIQPEGEYFENDLPEGGTCIPGIHVTSAAISWIYFGIDPTCQFWKVRFHQKDLLACDGKKCRIRGGTFTKIKRPF